MSALADSGEMPHRLQVMRWEQFGDMFAASWRQGEHVSFVGPTGSGKSVCALQMLNLVAQRKDKNGMPLSAVVLGLKPRDETLSRFIRATDFEVIKQWPPAFGEEHSVVWPKGFKASDKAKRQRLIFEPLLDIIYQEGGQIIEISEAAYFERAQPHGLGLSGQIEQFWSEARSSHNSLFAETQRPRNVSRLMWSEPSWVVIFALEDIDDLKRVAEASGQKNAVLLAASRLGGHEFLCVRRQRGGERGLYVSKVDV